MGNHHATGLYRRHSSGCSRLQLLSSLHRKSYQPTLTLGRPPARDPNESRASLLIVGPVFVQRCGPGRSRWQGTGLPPDRNFGAFQCKSPVWHDALPVGVTVLCVCAFERGNRAGYASRFESTHLHGVVGKTTFSLFRGSISLAFANQGKRPCSNPCVSAASQGRRGSRPQAVVAALGRKVSHRPGVRRLLQHGERRALWDSCACRNRSGWLLVSPRRWATTQMRHSVLFLP